MKTISKTRFLDLPNLLSSLVIVCEVFGDVGSIWFCSIFVWELTRWIIKCDECVSSRTVCVYT